jgi:hypothetical protein
MAWHSILHYDGKFLTLSLECIILIDPLLELVERQGKKRSKPRKPLIGISHTDENGQMLMFPIPTERRIEYDKFARTLEHFLPDNKKAGSDFRVDWNLEFTRYEFYEFFERFTDDLPAAIKDLKRLAAGEQLEDYEPLIKFLGNVQSAALWAHEGLSRRGGCF